MQVQFIRTRPSRAALYLNFTADSELLVSTSWPLVFLPCVEAAGGDAAGAGAAAAKAKKDPKTSTEAGEWRGFRVEL